MIQVTETWDETNSFMIFVIFNLSVVFVILPIFTNFFQLHQSIQSWVIDIQAWIQTNLRSLYAMCVLFGSAFTAIELCNSNLFGLPLFNMELNQRQKAMFQNQRFLSTVLVQVCDIFDFVELLFVAQKKKS